MLEWGGTALTVSHITEVEGATTAACRYGLQTNGVAAISTSLGLSYKFNINHSYQTRGPH